MSREPHKLEHWNPGVRFGLGLTLMTACLSGLIPGLPRIMWLLGFIAGLVIMVHSATPFYQDQRKKWLDQAKAMPYIYGMAACGLVFIILTIAYFKTVGKPEAHKNITAEAHAGSAVSDLFVRCEAVGPYYKPSAGRLNWLMVAPAWLPYMTGGFASGPYDGGSMPPWAFMKTSDVYKCEVINYGREAAFNLYMWLHIVYNGNSSKRSDEKDTVIAEVVYPLTIDVVPTNPQTPFIFFLSNYDPATGYIDILKTIKFDGPDGTKIASEIRQPEPRYSRMLLFGTPQPLFRDEAPKEAPKHGSSSAQTSGKG